MNNTRRLLFCLTLMVGVLLVAGPALGAVSAADEAYATGAQLFATDHFADAIPELKQFIADFPTEARVYDALFTLGRCYQGLKQWDDAVKTFTQVTTKATGTELVKRRAEAYYQLAESYYQQAESQGQTHAYEDAAQAYRVFLKLAAENELSRSSVYADLVVNAQYYLGESLYRLDRLAEALGEFRKVTEIAPQDALAPWARYSVGMIQLRQAHYSEAITALEAVLTQTKDTKVCTETTRLLGYAYSGRARQQKDDAAKAADFTHALQLFTAVQGNTTVDADSRRQALLEEAQIYADLQQYDKAATAFDSVLAQLEPADQSVLEVRAQRANMFYHARRYREAAADYAVVADSRAPAEIVTPALYFLGNSSYLQGRDGKDKDAYTQAVRAFHRYLALTPPPEKVTRATLLLALCQEDLSDLGDSAAGKDAVTTFKTLLEKWPSSPEAGEARKGIAHLTSGMSTDELKQVIGLLPEDAAASATLRLAHDAFLAGHYPEAMTEAQQVLDGKPTPVLIASAAYLIAASQQRLNHPKEAIPFYLRALANSKEDAVTLIAQRGLTKAYLDTRQYAEACDAARALLRLPAQAKEGDEREKEIAERYTMLAQAAAGAKQYSEAGDAYSHVVKDCPASPLVPNALMGLGWSAENKKDGTAAIAAYQQLVDKFPTDTNAPDAYYRLGFLLNESKAYQRAIDMLQKVPASYQYADQAAYLIAWAYHDLDKQVEANDAFNRLAEQFPKSPLAGDSLYRIGEYWLEHKNDVEAVHALSRALELLPAASKLRPTVAYRLGVTAFSQKNYPLAVTSFDTVLTECPGDENTGDCLFWKGQALELQGNDHAQAAREAYRKCLASFPNGPLVLDAALGAGRAALQAKQYATALTDLQQALELCATLGRTGELGKRADNVKPEAKFTLGECYFAQAQYPDAVKQYAGAAALAMEPWYSKALLQEARCSALTHDATAAASTLRLLLKTSPNSDAAKEAPKVAQEYGLTLEEAK